MKKVALIILSVFAGVGMGLVFFYLSLLAHSTPGVSVKPNFPVWFDIMESISVGVVALIFIPGLIKDVKEDSQKKGWKTFWAVFPTSLTVVIFYLVWLGTPVILFHRFLM